MSVQEIHGIFQFADDFFPEEYGETAFVLPKYTPKTVFPQWYLEEQDDPSSASSALSVFKARLDYLYYAEKYDEACELGQEHIKCTATIRRETFEAVLMCAAKAGRKELGLQMLEHLESLDVEDAGLLYVCKKAKELIDM